MKDYVFNKDVLEPDGKYVFEGTDGEMYALLVDEDSQPIVQDTQGSVFVWRIDWSPQLTLVGDPTLERFESLPLEWSTDTFKVLGGFSLGPEAEAPAEATAKQKKKEKKKMAATTKRTRGARAKGAIKNTGKHAMHAASGALQAAAAVKVTDLLIQKLVEQVGPKAPGFAEFAGTPMGRAVLSIGIPALIRTGVEMYREGREDETGEVSAWLNRAQAIADLSFGANIGKVSVDALGALWSAGAEFLPLIMQATGEAPTMPHQLGAPTITMDAPPTGARARAKAGGEE